MLDTLAAAAEVGDEGVEWEPAERKLAFNRRLDPGQLRWIVRDQNENLLDASDPDLAQFLASFDRPRTSGQRRLWTLDDQQHRPWRVGERRIEEYAPKPHHNPVDNEQEDHSAISRKLVFRAAVSLSEVNRSLWMLALALFLLAAALLAVVFAFANRLIRCMLKPLIDMAEAAKSIGAFDLHERIPQTAANDELGELGGSFNGLLDRLEESFERQRRFTGDASHQLRTPLTALQGQVDLSLRQARSSQEYEHTLRIVQKKSRELRNIVESLLFLARADSESRRPLAESLDLNSCLAVRLEAWSEHPRRRDFRIEMEPPGEFRVEAPAHLLAQLVDILLENAVKYSKEGSPITIRLAADERHVQLSVEDRGTGVDPEDLPHIFEPFFRGQRRAS